MQEEQYAGLDRVDAVWQRVTASHGGKGMEEKIPGELDTAVLEELMDMTAGLWKRYSLLARRTGGQTSRILFSLAGSARNRLQQLQLEYFLSAGDTYVPAALGEEQGGILATLRKAWREEQNLAERCMGCRCRESQKELLYACGEESLRSSDRVRELIRIGLR